MRQEPGTLYPDNLSGKRQVRLLRILPDSTEECPNFEMSVHPLADGLRYTALSYAWGVGSGQHAIRVNGIGLCIMPNLLTALRSFHERKVDCYLWADAICINQRDEEEKQTQVGLMGEVFRLAERTVIWLGPASADSDSAMDLVANLEAWDFQEPKFSANMDKWLAITTLLRREWWTRLWVLQEAFLSVQPIARCGDKDVPFERFVVLKELYEPAYWEAQDRWLHMNLFQNVPFTSVLSNWRVTKQELATLAAGGGSTLFSWVTSLSTKLRCTEPLVRVRARAGRHGLPAARGELWSRR